MTTILTTTGISLKINTSRKYDVKEPTDDQIRQYLRTQPEQASAEANSLLQIASLDDQLVLFHTSTSEAERCARLLQEFFINDKGFKHVRLTKLEFQDDEKHIETLGIRNLINALIDEIEKAQKNGQEVIINATAGLKAQIVYSTMLGMLYHVPVKYMYETFKRLVTFNPVPLDWDTSLFLTYSWFFRWLQDDFRTQSEVSQKLQSLQDADTIQALLTTPDNDDYVILSAMGIALQRKLEYEIEEAELAPFPPAATTATVSEKVSNAILHEKHHYPKTLRDICLKIASLTYVQEVTGGFFENTTRSQIKRPYPDGTISLIIADGEKASNLTVRTTAQGKSQTLKVALEISQLLGIHMMSETK